jgi:hypothetical protein
MCSSTCATQQDSREAVEVVPDALNAAVRALEAILAEGTSVCKGWSCSADVTTLSSSAETDEGASMKSRWWEWRRGLESRLQAWLVHWAALTGPALQLCLPERSRCSTSPTEPSADDNKAVLLLLANDLHRTPWEAVQELQGRPVYRILHDRHVPRRSILQGQVAITGTAPQVQAALAGAAASAHEHTVDSASVVYLVDPAGDLAMTRDRFKGWFAAQAGWSGSAGTPAMPRAQLRAELARKDVFLYLGHGAGVPLFSLAPPMLGLCALSLELPAVWPCWEASLCGLLCCWSGSIAHANT